MCSTGETHTVYRLVEETDVKLVWFKLFLIVFLKQTDKISFSLDEFEFENCLSQPQDKMAGEDREKRYINKSLVLFLVLKKHEINKKLILRIQSLILP